MNILLIGNGFDLAHGLPTRYIDFLDWIVGEYKFFDDLKKQGADIVQGISKIELNVPPNRQSKHIINEKINCQEELWECIHDNTWFEYFLYSQIQQDATWIDFESEISEAIQSIDKNMQGDIDGFVTQLDNWYLNKKFVDLHVKKTTNKIKYLKFSELRDRLLDDLNRLIRAFEIYLCEYIKNVECKYESPDIKDVYIVKHMHGVTSVQLAKVINFNYTDTFQRLYDNDKKFECEYVHGKADIKNNYDTNNMVLGIDEYLKGKKKDKKIEFIAFKKYYQRIYKGTGCKYKDWIDEIREEEIRYKNEIKEKQKMLCYKSLSHIKSLEIQGELKKLKQKPPKHNLYIFGHSLDVSDKDILRGLILNDTVKTTIYYFSKDDLGKKITNLVKVIGQDELIRRTGGSTKTIEFKLQEKMTVHKKQQ